MGKTDIRGYSYWSDEDVVALARGIPDLFASDVLNHWVNKILTNQGRILGEARARPKASLSVSMTSGQKLRRQLEAARELLEREKLNLPPVTSVPQVVEPGERATAVKLRPVEWTALAHHPQVKPLLDKKVFVTPAQLVDTLCFAQREVLPCERWRNPAQWHSACYRAAKADGSKRDALSMLREGIKYQPLTKFVIKPQEPEPVEPAAPNKETTVQVPPTGAAPVLPANTLATAFMQLLAAAQECASQALAPIIERLERMEGRLAELPLSVRSQVADVVGGPAEPLVGIPVVDLKALPVYTPERLPRVDVVGLLNSQAEIVRRACGDKFNLRFLSAEEVERQPITAPDAIMLRRFVSHSAQERIKKAGAKLHFANGAAESVIAQLGKMATGAMH